MAGVITQDSPTQVDTTATTTEGIRVRNSIPITVEQVDHIGTDMNSITQIDHTGVKLAQLSFITD